MDKLLLTPTKAAHALGIGRSKVYELMQTGQLASVHIGACRRVHDLRHTGNTLAAATGASTKELMVRMGHASMRAALIYQHATADRDQAIAAALSRLATGDVTDAERDGRAGPPLHAQGRARPRATGT